MKGIYRNFVNLIFMSCQLRIHLVQRHSTLHWIPQLISIIIMDLKFLNKVYNKKDLR